MCGRFVIYSPATEVQDCFELTEPFPAGPRYNIAPTEFSIIVAIHGATGQPEWKKAKWGLIPEWSKDPKSGAKLINARCETIAIKPSFKKAFKNRRCLVPTNGFYEWKKENKRRLPHLIGLSDDKPFAFAGIWERWKSTEGEIVESFSIITTEANDLVAGLHDRMPVIVGPEDYTAWLDPTTPLNELGRIMAPLPSDMMLIIPVSSKVNKLGYDAIDCIEPFE